MVMDISMKLLALESANEQCSVALVNADAVLFNATDLRAKAQTQSILPLVEQALIQTQSAWQDLSAIAFSRGPGSFSGVRINAAVAQALAWAHDLPVVAVSTLQALAQAAYDVQAQPTVTAVLDARMQEVYIGNFQVDAHGIMQLQGQEQLLSYAAAREFARFGLVGSGAALLQDQTAHQSLNIQPNATHIAKIALLQAMNGQGLSPELALPVYLRDNAWKKIAEQGKARG